MSHHDIIEDTITVDIETLETDRPDVVEYVDAKVVPPANMTKAETIDAWTIDKRPDAVREAVSKTALDGGFGRIASIAFALGSATAVAATSAAPASGDVPAAYSVDQEIKVLDRFWAALEQYRQKRGRIPTIVGHNVVGFDIRWLWQRTIVLGRRPLEWWPVDAKPWEKERVFDTMTAWAGVGQRISQDRLALALGLPRKGDFDGSMVGAAWAAGEFDKIKSYNADDVETCRAIYKRIVGYIEPTVAAKIFDQVAPEADPAVEIVEVTREVADRPARVPCFRPGIKAPMKREEGAVA